MKIGIVPNFTREKAVEVTKNVIKQLEIIKFDYYFDINIKNEFPFLINDSFFINNLYQTVDLIIAIGGDGSFIHTAKDAALCKKPVLCINAGNLAFLAGLEGNELNLLKKLITGDYTKDSRLMLEVVVENNGEKQFIGFCLNDVAVARGKEIKLVDLDVFCDKRKINSYRADGVVISTPTGSTAYSWAAGGPVIDPSLQCIILTPLCTHSSLNRSLIFSDKSEITIKSVMSCSDNLFLSTDGETSVPIRDNSVIHISKSEYLAEFIRIKSDEFFDILNTKLTQRRI